jgi:hypothetical protein
VKDCNLIGYCENDVCQLVTVHTIRMRFLPWEALTKEYDSARTTLFWDKLFRVGTDACITPRLSSITSHVGACELTSTGL